MAHNPQDAGPYLDSHNLALLQALGSLTSGRPFHEYTIFQQRELFRSVQTPRANDTDIAKSHHEIETSRGPVNTYLYMPRDQQAVPFVFFVHGGGWIFGGAVEFEAFIFDIVQRTGLAVVFPEYTLAPEMRYPAQHEQCLEVLQDVLKLGGGQGLMTDKVVLAGDSSGCQIVTAISILNQQRSLDLPIVHQLMLHPYIDVTAELCGGILRDPVWAEQQQSAYFSSSAERSEILAAPGRMTVEDAKKYMPPTTMTISDQDPFKDQNEAFAKLLQTASVPCGVVQAFGSLHDVEIFHQARKSPTAQLLMLAICGQLKTTFCELEH